MPSQRVSSTHKTAQSHDGDGRLRHSNETDEGMWKAQQGISKKGVRNSASEPSVGMEMVDINKVRRAHTIESVRGTFMFQSGEQRNEGHSWLRRVGSAIGVLNNDNDRDRLQHLSLSRIQRGVSGLLTPVKLQSDEKWVEKLCSKIQPDTSTDTQQSATTTINYHQRLHAASLSDIRVKLSHGSVGQLVRPQLSEMCRCRKYETSGYQMDDRDVLALMDDVDEGPTLYGDNALNNYHRFIEAERMHASGNLIKDQLIVEDRPQKRKQLIHDSESYSGEFENLSDERKDNLSKNDENTAEGDDQQMVPKFTRVQLQNVMEYRAWCTYIYILMQALALIVTCCLHGLGDVSFLRSRELAEGHATILGREAVDSWNTPNPWVGPSPAALIRSGAVFAPCLRPDITLAVRRANALQTDFRLGCCYKPMGHTSATTTQQECDAMTYSLGQWAADEPCSWRTHGFLKLHKMARPCCVGLLGQCELTSVNHCAFLRGIFHPDGPEHCSQVDCMQRLCGEPSSPARDASRTSNVTSDDDDVASPRQHWRLVVGAVLPPGLFVFLPQAAVLAVGGRRVEAVAGAPRMLLISLLSCVGGLTAGALFTPLVPHSGSQAAVGGLLGVVTMEILHHRPFVTSIWWEVGKLMIFVAPLLLMGTLPYIDNYELLGGYVMGALAGLCLLPHISFGRWTAVRRRVLLAVAVPGIVLMMTCLLHGLYVVQTLSSVCPRCIHFTCVPYSDHLCDIITGSPV